MMFTGEALAHTNFANTIHDIALLNSLGVRLVLAYGARPQIDAALSARNLKPHISNGLRITDEAALECVKAAAGQLRLEIEAQLSMGLPNSPMHGARIRVVGGNFVTAKPMGILDGVDFCHTGKVRRIDRKAINRQLDDSAIVLLPNIGYSPTGEAFNLSVEDVATSSAIALQAEKLILFGQESGITNNDGELVRSLTLQDILTNANDLNPSQANLLKASQKACAAGVNRIHVVSHQEDGALLEELFTRDGVGSLITQNRVETIRTATVDDVGGILELIQPLESDGVLVRRSRELLENEISQFTIIELDGMIIGCAALYPFDDDNTTTKAAEVACVSVHEDYRQDNRGELLLSAMEQHAKTLNIHALFVLTTQSAHWFQERGFELSSVDKLPDTRQQLYNLQRNSKVFIKII